MTSKLLQTLLKMKKKNVPLDVNCTFRQLTTLGTGGTIYLTLFPQNVKQLIFVAKYLRRRKVLHCFLGHGSNVLASDLPYNGVVVVTTRVKNIFVAETTVTADCGASTSKLCSELVQNGLSGGEFFGCLPATVGGAVVCNAGCFGQCAADVVQSVKVLHKGKVKTLSNAQCNFSKRQSVFKNNGQYVVLQVTMRFAKSSSQQIDEVLAQMRKTKAETQPLGVRSAGCVLYNDSVPVSKLIDLAGFKGYTVGGAQVSEKHAGFVINVDKATSSDIYLLIEQIRQTLLNKYGVAAEREVCLVNFPRQKEEKCHFLKALRKKFSKISKR